MATSSAPTGSCYDNCATHSIRGQSCQCYFGCSLNDLCCPDFDIYCDGMAGIEEQEKLALAEVAAFSVFYSIIMFVVLFVMFMWALYSLQSHYKKHGWGHSFEQSGFVLADSKLMIILAYSGMAFYVLSSFCYLIANGSLGVEYNSHNDTYGNSQIAAIIFWFFGHTIFYALFIIKLYNFMQKTTYNMSKPLQLSAFVFLLGLWFVSTIVMIIWIDEFHNNYHYGSINDQKIMACMVIAFAAHIWFCLSLVLFFSITLYRVIKTKGTTLISSSGPTRGRKAELEEHVTEYMTRITVLCLSALSVNVFCLLMWIILIGLEDQSDGFLRFCWWLFPIDILFSYLSLFLGLNFSPSMNEVYKKVCVCPHAICKIYCVKATMPGNKSKRGVQIRDFDDDDDEDSDDDQQGQLVSGNKTKGSRLNGNNDAEEESEEDEDDDDSEDDSDRHGNRHGFNPLNTDDTSALRAGE